MTSRPVDNARTYLRVLLVGRSGGGNTALGEWVHERCGADVAGPTLTLTASVALASSWSPHVVLLDFHGLPISTPHLVLLFKEAAPAARVAVLTFDASEPMRRRCREARVDAVFDKNTELDALAAWLARQRDAEPGVSRF